MRLLICTFVIAAASCSAQLNIPNSGQASAYAPRAVVSSTVNVSSGTQTLISVTEAGLLSGVAVRVNTALTSGAAVVELLITVDGSAATVLTLFNAANSFTAAAATFRGGTGSVGDGFFLPLNVAYKTSLLVQQRVTISPDATGVLDWAIVRSIKL